MGSGKYQGLVATTAPASGGVNQRFCSRPQGAAGSHGLASTGRTQLHCRPLRRQPSAAGGAAPAAGAAAALGEAALPPACPPARRLPLGGPVPVAGEGMGSMPHEEGDFGDTIIAPLYEFLRESLRSAAVVGERVMYDDFNELFWDVERVKKLLPLSGTPGQRLGQGASHALPYRLPPHSLHYRHARAARDGRVPPLSRAAVRGREARGRRDGRAPRALLQNVPREGRLVPRVLRVRHMTRRQ